MRYFWPVCVLLAASAMAPIAARQGAQDSTRPVFRAGVDLVHLDVVVTGEGEKPISDLTVADFELKDNGKPQTITDFRFVNIPVVHRRLDLDQRAAASDVSTNAPTSPDNRLFVLIIDDLHLVEPTLVPVQRIMTEFLDTLSPDDEVAILFVGHSNLSQNFTNDPVRLRETVKNLHSAFGFGIGVTGRVQLEELPYDRAVAWEIQNAANALAHSGHARRAIVYVGTFSQLDPAAPVGTDEKADAELLQRYLNDAWKAARLADVPIYTLDPRGVPNMGNALATSRPHFVRNYTDETQNSPTGPFLPGQPQLNGGDVTASTEVQGNVDRSSPQLIQHRIQVQQQHLDEMAINTGGRSFINRSNLLGAVDEIVADNGSFYELGYYPDPVAHDGRFHSITVAVKRSGAHVRATKPGYVATGATAPAPLSPKQTLDSALGQGLNVSGLSLRAFAAPMAASAKGMSTVVTLEVTYPTPADGSLRIDDDLQVTVLGLDPDGKVKASSTQPWHFTGSVPQAGDLTFLVDDVVDLPSEPLTLRIGAVSKLVGRAGTVQLSLDVPKASGDKLQFGGIALGYAGPTHEMALGADLITPVMPFQPTTARTFAATDAVRLFGRIFWASKDPAAAVSVTVTGGNTPASTVSVSGVLDHGRRVGTLDMMLPLKNLTPGDYTLEITAELPDQQHVTHVLPFSIK